MPTSKTLAVFDAIAGGRRRRTTRSLICRNETLVLDFDDTAAEAIDFVGVVPRAYASSDLEVVVTWAATSATTGDVVWQAEFERHHVGDATHGTHDLDTDDFGTAATATSAATAASGELVQTAIALAAADTDDAAAGESFRLRVTRLATSGSDTMTGDAELVTVEVREV